METGRVKQDSLKGTAQPRDLGGGGEQGLGAPSPAPAPSQEGGCKAAAPPERIEGKPSVSLTVNFIVATVFKT